LRCGSNSRCSISTEDPKNWGIRIARLQKSAREDDTCQARRLFNADVDLRVV
jgi:hypothetical protein